MVIRGVNFIQSEDNMYIRETGKPGVITTWDDVVNHSDFKGLACIVETSADIDKLNPKDIQVEVFAVAESKYYEIVKEWAEIYTEEDGCKYYAIHNMKH